jgi:hypothetical protein
MRKLRCACVSKEFRGRRNGPVRRGFGDWRHPRRGKLQAGKRIERPAHGTIHQLHAANSPHDANIGTEPCRQGLFFDSGAGVTKPDRQNPLRWTADSVLAIFVRLGQAEQAACCGTFFSQPTGIPAATYRVCFHRAKLPRQTGPHSFAQ